MAPGLSIRAGGASRLRACASTAEKWLVGTRTPWRQPGLGPGPWLLIVSKARGSPAGQFGDVLLGHLRYIGISVQVQVEVQVQDQVQVEVQVQGLSTVLRPAGHPVAGRAGTRPP